MEIRDEFEFTKDDWQKHSHPKDMPNKKAYPKLALRDLDFEVTQLPLAPKENMNVFRKVFFRYNHLNFGERCVYCSEVFQIQIYDVYLYCKKYKLSEYFTTEGVLKIDEAIHHMSTELSPMEAFLDAEDKKLVEASTEDIFKESYVLAKNVLYTSLKINNRVATTMLKVTDMYAFQIHLLTLKCGGDLSTLSIPEKVQFVDFSNKMANIIRENPSLQTQNMVKIAAMLEQPLFKEASLTEGAETMITIEKLQSMVNKLEINTDNGHLAMAQAGIEVTKLPVIDATKTSIDQQLLETIGEKDMSKVKPNTDANKGLWADTIVQTGDTSLDNRHDLMGDL